MAIFRKFPYTNYHDLNLDWIIEQVKLYIAKCDILELDFKELKEYVDSLDIQEAVDNKLDEMADDGTLAAIIAQYLATQGLIAFDTVADLKAAANLVANVDVVVLGDLLYNDGKLNLYKIRNLSISDVVDEVNILSLTNYPTLVAELLRVEKSVVNVKYYGAKGDGVTNDIEAIKLARDAAWTKGLPLYFPAGDYLIGKDFDTAMLDSGIVINAPITIMGDGYASRIIASQNDPTPIQALVIVDTDDVIIRDICIDGSVDPDDPDWSSGYQVHGIRMQNCSNVLIDHVKVVNCLGYGIGAQQGTFQNVTINECYIDFTGQDGIDFKNRNSDNRGLKVLNTYVTNVGMNDTLANQYAQCCIDIRGQQSLISGCHCLRIPGDRNGIRLRATDSTPGGTGAGGGSSQITNCIVTGVNGNTGIGISFDEGGTISNCQIQRMGTGIVCNTNFDNIANCSFDRCTLGIHIGGYGIFVVNCLFTSLTKSVHCENTNAVFFTNCLFSGASSVMFELNSSNKVYICQSFARGTIGAQFSGTTSNVHISQCENIATP